MEELEGKEQAQLSPAEHLPKHTFVSPFTTLMNMEISLQKKKKKAKLQFCTRFSFLRHKIYQKIVGIELEVL